VSAFREPVIGDDHDLETYGRPAQKRAVTDAPQMRAHASYDRAAARARRSSKQLGAETHAPRPERARRAPVEEKSTFDADGIRTVKIKGQATPARRRGAQRSLAVQIDRYDRRPDRAAQWALFMGVFMIVVAIATGT
jgi:hypothetical protein